MPMVKKDKSNNSKVPFIASAYKEKGFIAPLDIVSKQNADALRSDFEMAEKELSSNPEKLALLKAYPNRLLPSFDQLTRNKNLIKAASAVLGPDLMVWSAALFIKEKMSSKIVSWHQDLTYWRLSDTEETTCWFAVSEASEASGCMKFVAGSHKNNILPHNDTYDEGNLLSRGQEIAVDVDEKDATFAALKAGQASMHHGLIFHSSGPNTTGDRRIGSAIRYIAPSMKQETGDRSLVTLVSGKDRYKNFNVVDAPRGRLLDEEFELCKRDNELKKSLLF